MTNIDRTDLLGGLLVAAVGAFFAIGALDYRMGTVTRMGPGFVPFSLGIVGVVLGLAIVAIAVVRGGDRQLADFRCTLVLPIVAAIAAFAVLLPRTGLVPASIVSMILASIASPRSRWMSMVPLAVAVSMVVAAAFVFALGLPIPVIRNPIQ